MADDSENLSSYLAELVSELRALLADASTPFTPDSIHDARVATRRLSAALDLLKPVLSKDRRRRAAKVLRGLRRKLGALRDLDVMIEQLESIEVGDACYEASQWAAHAMKHERESRCVKVGKALEKIRLKFHRWKKLEGQIAAAQEAVDCLLAHAVHVQYDEYSHFAAHVGDVDGSSRHEVDADARRLSEVHQLRIVGKRLRYVLEMAKVEGIAGARDAIDIFKELQEALGLWHDSVVLAEKLIALSVKQQLCLRNADLEKVVLKLADRELRLSEQHLGEFKQLWISHAARLGEIVHGGFILTRHVETDFFKQSKTDRDPSDSPESEGPGASPLPDAPAA